MTAISEQLDLLAAVHAGPFASEDRERIEAAMRRVAADNGGLIDPNKVREALTNEYGLTVYPRRLSSAYSGLRRLGVIERTDEKVPNTDKRGRNLGKEQTVYRLVSA
jgi:hypothetical protein